MQEIYYERLKVIQGDSSEWSTSNLQQINTKIIFQCWNDIVEGKSRGRCYGTMNLAVISHGVSSLTQSSLLALTTNQNQQLIENEQLFQQVQEVTKSANATTTFQLEENQSMQFGEQSTI